MMFDAINGMLLDMLAAIGRKDFEDRRRRQAQGISRAMAEGKFKGRPENTERNSDIADMLAEGKSWNTIQRVTNCSRATIAKVAAKRSSAERALA
jgi:DNA invertase Pin-like site-specific DNA recombinase